MLHISRRELMAVAAAALGSLSFLLVGSPAFGQSGPEEVSGRTLREEIEKRAEGYIARLERKKKVPFTEDEKRKIIDRIWKVSKAELEKGNVYLVMDP